MRYPTRGYQTRSRASNQTRHEGAGLPEDDIENGPILGAESGDGAIMPLDRKIYISARKAEERGEDLSRKVVCTTIVSAPMADDIAEELAFELRRTLTGFKFIGEQVGTLESEGRESDFLMGFEESYGYLAGTSVRDKDAVVASMLICELAAHWKNKGMDLYEAMECLYERHGFWSSALLGQAYEGPEGAAEMAAMMTGLRKSAPAQIAGIPVTEVIDYAPGAIMPVVNPSAKPQDLPTANVLEFRLEGGSRVLIRPSGTEPKAKAYVFARGADRVKSEALLGDLVTEAKSILEGNR